MTGILNRVGARSGIVSDSGTASAGTKTLSGTIGLDYEEGTWTPNTNSAGTYTFTLMSSYYTKIGRMVTIQAYLAGNDNGDGTGLVIHGLPFASAPANHYSVGAINFAVGNSSLNGKDCTARIGESGSSIYFSYNGQVDIAQNVMDNGHFIFSATYFAAS